MNKDRRKRIEKALETLNEVQSELEDIKSEEEDYFDNIPENLQASEKAETSEAAINSLEEALSQVEEAVNALEEIE